MPAWGLTQAGFVVKPLANILADMQAQVLATVDPQLDLSENTPDGQILAANAAEAASVWELLQSIFNMFNRSDAEGAALDNVGDLVGIPREGESFTQVLCNCTLTSTGGPLSNGVYPAGVLVANVAGQSTQVFSNLNPVTVTSSGVQAGIVFQATTPGQTPAVNTGTLTAITTPVAGWTAVTNPSGQQQLGSNAELDPIYSARQAEELAGEGSCNPSSTAAALVQLGGAQMPTPISLTVTIIENTSYLPRVVQGIAMSPTSYLVVIDDGNTGWASGAGQQLIAQTIWANKPAGVAPIGAISVTITDPILGQQTVGYSTTTAVPIWVRCTVVPRPGVNFTALQATIQTALATASTAPTPLGGQPPAGQLTPGAPVVGSQLEAVIGSVPGVFDVQAVTFDVHSSPTNTAPIVFTQYQKGSIVAANVTVTLGTYP